MGAPGFDDAPVAAIACGPAKHVTFVYPYYCNLQFLKFQMGIWRGFAQGVREWLSAVLVDDGSPDQTAEEAIKGARFTVPVMGARVGFQIGGPAGAMWGWSLGAAAGSLVDPQVVSGPAVGEIRQDLVSDQEPDAASAHDSSLPFPMRLFRIDVDVRWNWLAARNIGMKHADGWCLLTDMDHVVTETTARALIHGQHDPNVIYRLSRREHTGQLIHPHPNSMLMTRKMFWKVGGYDETLSGHYGTDGDWRRRCAATAAVRTLRDELVRYEYQQDSSTTRYLRKQPEDAGKKRLLAQRRPGWKPRTLSFPFHEVAIS